MDVLASYGWIDGIRRKLDDDSTMQVLSPRKTDHRNRDACCGWRNGSPVLICRAQAT